MEACLRAFYAASPMVRVHATPELPQIQHVVRTNYIDLGFELKQGRPAAWWLSPAWTIC